MSSNHIAGEFSGVGDVEITLMVGDTEVDVTQKGNQFTAAYPEKLAEGDHTVSVMITDANEKTANASAAFSIVYPDAMISITSPAASGAYDHEFRYIEGEFTGVGPVDISLMVGETEVKGVSIAGMQFSATLPDKLPEGDHKVTAKIKDANDEEAGASTEFKVTYPDAMVSIASPAAGSIHDHEFSHIAGEFSGVGEVEITLMVGDMEVDVTQKGNQFTAAYPEKLAEGDHTVSVMITDANGETANASAAFSIAYPDAMISITSPAASGAYDHEFRYIEGEFTGVGPVDISLMVGETEVKGVSIAGMQFSATLPDKLPEGDHKVTAKIKDANDEEAAASTEFKVTYPDAMVSIASPAAGSTHDHEFSHIAGEFSGVGEVEITLMVGDKEVDVTQKGNQFTAAYPEKLAEGDHTVSVMITDANEKTANASAAFSIVYPMPMVSIAAPAAGSTHDHEFSHIAGEFSGVGEVEITLMVGDKEVDVTQKGNQFTAAYPEKLAEGDHTVSVMITDANEKTANASAAFSIAYPMPTVMIQSPAAGHMYGHSESVAILGEFTGVDKVDVDVTLDGKAVEGVSVKDNQFTANLKAATLSDGEHRIDVTVTDANKKTAQTSTIFKVNVPGPTVELLSPAAGQTYDHGKPVVRGTYTGVGDITLMLAIDDGDPFEVAGEDNQFTYMPPEELGGGEHTVSVTAEDANGKTAHATVVFSIELDSTPPVISEVSPSGVVRLNKADVLAENFAITISAVVSDDESDILDVNYVIDGGDTNTYPVNRVKNRFEIVESFTAGPHTVKLSVTSKGGTREFSWQFVLEVDDVAPVISSITPTGTLHAGLPTISASAVDASGVTEMVITLMDSSGEVVEGETQDDDEDRINLGITRLDFHPAEPLTEGTYVIEVRATDAFGNSATAKGGFTIDFDTAAPIITMASPQNGARLMYDMDEARRPTISITYADAETGIDVDSIRFVLNDNLITLTAAQKSASQVVYVPDADLEPGQYAVKLEVSDRAHQQGNVSDENEGARKANMAVYEFGFSVEVKDGPILAARPINYPNPFKDEHSDFLHACTAVNRYDCHL